MDKIRFRVNVMDYVEWPGTVANQRTISEYSVGVDHSVSNDRSNARYLIEDNIREGLDVDLKIGHRLPGTYLDKASHHRNVPSLQSIIAWAISQDGATMKEVFDNADFATRRGTMKRIASTLVTPQEAWTITAQDVGGVILLAEMSEMYRPYGGDVATYSGFKFEQYMTTGEPNGQPDTRSPIDVRPTFEIVTRSDLIARGRTLKLCCAGELDALSGEEPIEFKTCKHPYYLLRDIPKMVDSELVGVRRIVVGMKRDDNILERVMSLSWERIKDVEPNRNSAAQCYSLLCSVLTEIKNFLVDNDACRVSYDPNRMVFEINSISRQQAKVDFGKEQGENGEFLIEKLLMDFNL